jgi:hypothetical protein
VNGQVSEPWTGGFPDEPNTISLAQGEVQKALGYSYYVPALRIGTNFRSQGPGHRPEEKHKPSELSQQHFLWYGRETAPPEFSPMTDEEIVQTIVDLDYRAYREKKPGIRGIIGRIAEIASEITEGFFIEFQGIGEDSSGLFPQFKTPDGVVPLGSLSQGTQSIIQWLSYFMIGYSNYYDFPPTLEDKPGVLLIDEVDAHLHPSWQRRILPTLTKYFPKLTIFCSTHSPLMLTGLGAGQVHLLKRDAKGKVTVSRNKTDSVGWSADEVLRTFLDVATPTDLRTERDLQRLQALRRKENLSAQDAEQLEQLRYKVSQELLGSLSVAEGDPVSAWLEGRQKGSASHSLIEPPEKKSVRRPGSAAKRVPSAQRKNLGKGQKSTKASKKR